jgi:16S rRNA (cytosine1402-N4)-methyltransferase
VAHAVPRRFHPKKIHVATRVFQALRIAVNSELENLARIIDDGVQFLRPGAAFCIISFHSLEDRLVKRKFKNNKMLDTITVKPVVASPEEVAVNPRSRSARLRVARRRKAQEGMVV